VSVTIVSTNDFDDFVLKDLMKIYETIALEHVGPKVKLMKMWRFDVLGVDQVLW